MKFREWLIESTTPTEIPADIPVPEEAKVISRVLKRIHGPSTGVYMVGGAVRDYLFAIYHGGGAQNYKPKDVDLTTNLSEKQILDALRTTYAEQQKIKVKEKTSVATFGVVFVSVNNSQTIEVAPFRKDIGGNGRQPDAVERGTMYDDAMRRDFTVNNLYYDFDRKLIIDPNPNSQGVTDIKNKVIKTVGSPYDRFEEDKLRVLRFMRFFSRFNSGDIMQFIDRETLGAIKQYQPLQSFGITPERILDEFTKGIKSAQNTAQFLKNYESLGLLESVFPGLNVSTQDITRIGNSKNIKAIYAVLLRQNNNAVKTLESLKYPLWVSEGVQFLIDLMSFDHSSAITTLKRRGKEKEKLDGFLSKKDQLKKDMLNKMPEHEFEDWFAERKKEFINDQDLQEFLSMTYGIISPELAQRIKHLIGYKFEMPKFDDLPDKTLKGAAIGSALNNIALNRYGQSWADYQNSNPQATATDSSPQRNVPGIQS